MNPVARGALAISKVSTSSAVRRPAPVIAIEPSRNENSAACVRFIPSMTPVAIVDPERETPGIRAKAWDNPMRRDLETWRRGDLEILIFSPMRKYIPVIIMTIPTAIVPRKIWSIRSSRVKPAMTAGIVPIRR